MNRIEFIGNVGRDAEMRYTPSGQAVTNFSVGVNEKYTTSSGEKVSKTTWFRVTTWGRQAEVCNEFVRKGMKVYISGKLNPDEGGNPRIWETSDGKPAASFEVTAREVEFLSSRGDGNNHTERDGSEVMPIEDDIPF